LGPAFHFASHFASKANSCLESVAAGAHIRIRHEIGVVRWKRTRIVPPLLTRRYAPGFHISPLARLCDDRSNCRSNLNFGRTSSSHLGIVSVNVGY
jgi:hypothetical protein